MGDPVVSNPTVGTLAEVKVIYQIGPVQLFVIFIATYLSNPDKT